MRRTKVTAKVRVRWRNLSEKWTNAIPHVRMMVIAIRHKDQIHALESGRAALAELNGSSALIISGRTEPTLESKGAAAEGHEGKPTRKRRLLVQARQMAASTGL